MSKLLSNAPPSQVFWLDDGRSLKSLGELAAALKDMPEQVFNHHVTPGKNDFASWIKGVFHDDELAKRIEWAADKAKMADMILEALQKEEALKKQQDESKEEEKKRLLTRLKERLTPVEHPKAEPVEFNEQQIAEAKMHHKTAAAKALPKESNAFKYFTIGLAAGIVVVIMAALAYTIFLNPK